MKYTTRSRVSGTLGALMGLNTIKLSVASVAEKVINARKSFRVSRAEGALKSFSRSRDCSKPVVLGLT